jgi:hypothetical protein
MRGWLAASAAACLVLIACSEQDPSQATAPDAPGAPALSVYRLGNITRAVPHPCPAAGSRQFDFWVGKWDVIGKTGAHAATSIISSEMDGCLVMEDYVQDNGVYNGRSLSVYDPNTGHWYQTFVDDIIAGSYRLEGAFTGGSMVLSGSQPVYNFGTGTVQQRDVTVTWTPLDGGRVRQRFDVSTDGGPVATGFDGTYLPAEQLTRGSPIAYRFCTGAITQFQELNFWVGQWTVSADQTDLGTSEVRKDLNGCLIQEDFSTPKGYRSRSFSYFDFVVEKWFRTFADNTGQHFELSGNVENGAMVMTGTATGPGGQPRAIRVTLAPDGSGGVRETWERAGEGGAGWEQELVLGYQP